MRMSDEHEDKHAQQRERKADKQKKGMRVTNRSVFLLQEIIGRRANGDAPKGKKRKRKRGA